MGLVEERLIFVCLFLILINNFVAMLGSMKPINRVYPIVHTIMIYVNYLPRLKERISRFSTYEEIREEIFYYQSAMYLIYPFSLLVVILVGYSLITSIKGWQ